MSNVGVINLILVFIVVLFQHERTMRRIEGYVEEWLLGFDLQVHHFIASVELEIGIKASEYLTSIYLNSVCNSSHYRIQSPMPDPSPYAKQHAETRDPSADDMYRLSATFRTTRSRTH